MCGEFSAGICHLPTDCDYRPAGQKPSPTVAFNTLSPQYNSQSHLLYLNASRALVIALYVLTVESGSEVAPHAKAIPIDNDCSLKHSQRRLRTHKGTYVRP